MSSELPLPHSGGTHLYVSLAGFHVRKYHVDMPAARAKSGGRLEHLATPSAILRGHIVIAVAVLHHRRRRTGNDNGPWLGQDGLQPDLARCSPLADARERNRTGSRAPRFSGGSVTITG
jgi:hypothetical protein